MDTLSWLTLIAVVVNLSILVNIVAIKRGQSTTNRQQAALLGLLTARQSKMRSERTSTQAPGVDARARTTRRDTKDIPTLGGTQRPLKFRTVGGDQDARVEDRG